MTDQTIPAGDPRPGSIIREYRLRSGLSQEDLAERTQLSTRTIQRIENGETQPRGDSLKRIAEVLEVTIEDLQPSPLAGQASGETLRTDRSYLTLLTLSPLAFLLFPLLALVAPLTLWLMKRETIAGVQEVGRPIVNFQITWLLLLGAVSAPFYYEAIYHLEFDWFPSRMQYVYFLYAFYGWNIVRTIMNSILVGRNKTLTFGLAIPFIRA